MTGEETRQGLEDTVVTRVAIPTLRRLTGSHLYLRSEAAYFGKADPALEYIGVGPLDIDDAALSPATTAGCSLVVEYLSFPGSPKSGLSSENSLPKRIVFLKAKSSIHES